MHAARIAPTALALLALLCSGARAQTPTTGVLEGAVVDALDAPLAEVQITLSPVEGGATRRVLSSRSGRFQVLLVAPGEYDVLVERLGMQPVRYTGVPVRARRSTHLRAVLEPAAGPIGGPAEIAFEGVSGISQPGATEVLGTSVLRGFSDRQFDPAELLRLSSRGDSDLSMEGLPPAFTAVTIDGLAFRGATLPGMSPGPYGALVHTLAGIQQAELFGGPVGVQNHGLGGGLVALASQRGGGPENGRLLATGSVLGSDLPDEFRELRGSGELSTPLLGDSAQLAVFGSYSDGRAELTRWPTPADAEAIDALFTAGYDPLPGGGLFDREDSRLNLGGRFDWLLGEHQSLGVTALYAQADGTALPGSDGALRLVPHTASDLLLGASYNARITESIAARMQVGFSNSRRELETAGGPSVLVAEPRLAADASLYAAGSSERTDVQAQAAGMLQAGDHLFELGVGGLFSNHEIFNGFGRNGVFLFGRTADVDAAAGTYLRTTGAVPVTDFTTQELYVFAQDRWTITPGLDLRTGGRVSSTSLPQSDIVPATEWRELTGIDNTALPDRITGFGVSGGFEWNVQLQNRWFVRADFTMESGLIAPELLAEALTLDGRARLERYTGELTGFPDAPDAEDAIRLTIIDRDFEAPLTTRASFGFAAAVTSNTSLLLGGAIRQTTGLPLRTDLNLLTEASAADQYGRSVHAALVQAGGVVAPGSGTGRRFVDYDIVSGVAADAESQYWGITGGIEHRGGSGLDLFASYTYSKTTDELPGAGYGFAGAAATPVGDLAPRDWHDGTSDFDVPHRAGVGAMLRLPMLPRVSLGGSFSYASGRPFTPGFGAGIDANGDGVFGNDPAFVDPELEGMDALITGWDCLRENAGRFVERNACRTPARKALDLRFEAAVLEGSVGIDLLVEALDLLGDAAVGYDNALYALDPETPAELDPGDGAVFLPLVVNPNFGEPLPTVLDPARVRVGLRMRF